MIRFGVLSPKISEQIAGTSENYDKDADAIDRLYVRGILSGKETDNARKRLVKRIERDIKENGGE